MRGQNVERIVKRFYKKINRNTSRHCSAFDNIESLIHNSLVNGGCAKEFERHLGIVFCSLLLALRQNAGASKCKQKMIKKTEIHWILKLTFEVFWRDCGANTRIHYFFHFEVELVCSGSWTRFSLLPPEKGRQKPELGPLLQLLGVPAPIQLECFL